MAVSPQRGHPGGDQSPFRFERMRSNPLFLEAHLVWHEPVGVLEKAVGAVQHKREVRSSVINLSLSLIASGLHVCMHFR